MQVEKSDRMQVTDFMKKKDTSLRIDEATHFAISMYATQKRMTRGDVIRDLWLKYVSANADSTQDGYPSATKGQYPSTDAENDKRSILSYAPEDAKWFQLLAGVLKAGGQWADFARKMLQNIADQAGVKPDERSEYQRAQDLIDTSEEALGIAPEASGQSAGDQRFPARRRKALGE